MIRWKNYKALKLSCYKTLIKDMDIMEELKTWEIYYSIKDHKEEELRRRENIDLRNKRIL